MSEHEYRPTLSVVSPVHDEATTVRAFAVEVNRALTGIPVDYEVILVDDGSSDSTWERIVELSGRDPRIRGLSLSRNFGKEAAVRAGLVEAAGAAVVVLDSDLQHPPELMVEMVELWHSGKDVVEAVKRNRADQSLTGRLAARSFNRLFSWLTRVDLTNATDYRLLSRAALDALLSLPERSSFFRGTSTWIGFDRAQVPFDVASREAGASRWTGRSLCRMAINAITAFTAAPLHLVTFAGLVFAAFAFGLGAHTLWRWAAGAAVQGFTTVILVILLQGTFVLVGLGVIGEYVARIHDEVKARPPYIIARRTESTG
jgi:polyisoprenyl-phosphate glycosyltransferase